MSLGDQTPTLSFDFSGPHPVAVTGARFMLLFVWRLDTVRLLWAFAVPGKTKESVRSCLNDVIAELNTYTGGSKPPVLQDSFRSGSRIFISGCYGMAYAT